MTVVRGIRLDAFDGTVAGNGHGESAGGGSDDAIDAAVARLLDPVVDRLAGAERVVLVPDATYPFHPSTGLVTNPAVLRATLAWLGAVADAECVVAGASTECADARQTATFLGYRSIADSHDARSLDVDDVESVTRVETVDGRAVPVDVPVPLADHPVIVVPSLRIGSETPVVGACTTLARLLGADVDQPLEVVAAIRAIDPVCALVDGTDAFVGEPARVGALFAATNAFEADAVAASVLGVGPDEVPTITAGLKAAHDSIEVRGLDVERLRSSLPDGEMPAPDAPHPLLSRGYRLYTSLTGDAFPPQLLEVES